jgi:hypothetical protein
MTNTTTTLAAILKASKARDTASLSTMLTTLRAEEQSIGHVTGIQLFKVWQSQGTVIDAISRAVEAVGTDVKVTPASAEKALASVGISMPRTTISERLRANRVTTETVVACDDAIGTDDGPVNTTVPAILRWCEAHQGIETATSGRGASKAPVTKVAHDQHKEQESKKREQASKEAEQAQQERLVKLSKARATSKLGLVTVAQLKEASDEIIAATIVACQDVLAARAIVAAAEAAKAKKAQKATDKEQEEAKKLADLVAAEKAKSDAKVAELQAKLDALMASK